jgi:hypothetical protein
MCLCREVRFSAFLLSCIVVLLSGTGAFGTEAARGVSVCTWPTPCSFVVLPSGVPGGIRSRSIAGEMIRPQASLADGEMVAMAIPDGPGAVCLGVMGFLCVALVRNRRIWISLCLFVLSNGRAGAARMSELGVPGPEYAGPDLLTGVESLDSLPAGTSSWQDRGGSDPWSAVCLSFPGILERGLVVRPLSFGWLRDDRAGKGLLSQTGIELGGPSRGRPTRIHANVVKWPVSKGYVQWARPPPARSPHALLG